MERKPSHFGSKLSGPSGMSLTDLASIGDTGGITGRSIPSSSPTQCASASVTSWLGTYCRYHDRRCPATSLGGSPDGGFPPGRVVITKPGACPQSGARPGG